LDKKRFSQSEVLVTRREGKKENKKKIHKNKKHKNNPISRRNGSLDKNKKIYRSSFFFPFAFSSFSLQKKKLSL
jgi:hypothetical protein